jgi:hypothetical protein
MNQCKAPEEKEQRPTTFRDDPPLERCATCQAPAVGLVAGEARCSQGHTWKAERRVLA